MTPYSELFKLLTGFCANIAVALMSLGVLAPTLAAANLHTEADPISRAWCFIGALWMMVFTTIAVLQAK